MNWKAGNLLPQNVQRECKARYVHRYTCEHIPQWVKNNPTSYPYPHFATDAEWLANTSFAVTKDNKLDERAVHCQSNPTWPKGKAPPPKYVKQ